MIGDKKIACIIPARLQSTRFPRKMLSTLRGKPLLQWVWEQAKGVRAFDHVAFAVDAQETADLIASFGGVSYMTPVECTSGTDRLVEVMRQKHLDADIWVNWQGDEPFISEQMIETLLQTCAHADSDIWTLKKKIVRTEEALSPHIAKVVCDYRGFALFFSRSIIPFYRDVPLSEGNCDFYKHVGLYAFSKEALHKIALLPYCAIEGAEQLEQLRFLYHNLRIQVHETQEDVFGIDLPEHLARAEVLLANK
ncbi:MAG TPA: 3-deoxy-manno-octulosonate cytidylyltransferase [Rhabdochlamydiaceae bacterium]|jgi:3-deoxy-manno-octulosonate cytidylyltransferase (CMP-KDO synthetase)